MNFIQLNTKIQEKKQEIINISAKYGVSKIKVFGSSYARGEETPESDIDFLMDIPAGKSLLHRISLQQELEDLLGIKVDIAKPENLHEFIKVKILQEMIEL